MPLRPQVPRWKEAGSVSSVDPTQPAVAQNVPRAAAGLASVNLHEAVIDLGGWEDSENLQHGLLMRHSVRPVHLLLIEKLHIHADGIDLIHERETDESVDEVLVLSRHAAKSGIPSLTVHAIGVPGEVPHGEVGFAGGEKGLAVPPSPRFSAIYSTLRS